MPKKTVEGPKGKSRGQGEGGVWQVFKTLDDGTKEPSGWRGTIELDRGPDGKRRQKSITANTKKDLLAKIELAKKKAEEQEKLGLEADDNRTLAEYLEWWLTSPKVLENRPSTQEMYAYLIRSYIAPELGNVKLVKLNPSMVDSMLAKIAKPGYGLDRMVGKHGLRRSADGSLSPRTVQLVRQTLLSALSTAENYRLIAYNPAAKSHRPSHTAAKVKTFSAAEINKLIEVAGEDRIGQILRFLIATGLRRGEIGALRWEDVDYDAPSVEVQGSLSRRSGALGVGGTKTKKSARSIALGADALAVLREQKARQAQQRLDARMVVDGSIVDLWEEQGFIFTVANGGPIDGRAVLRWLGQLCDKAEIPRRSVHALRHSFATIALENNAQLVVVSQTLGHTTIRVTADIYSHVGQELQLQAVDAVAKAIGR